MAPILLWLILFLCLFISVIKYIVGLIMRLSFPSAKIRKDYTWQPTVSVLLPCYNEGRTVYNSIETISKSNYPNDRFEVIAQDDCSVDDSYEWMLKAQRDFTNIPIRVGRNTFQLRQGAHRLQRAAIFHRRNHYLHRLRLPLPSRRHPRADRLLRRTGNRLGRRPRRRQQPQRQRHHCDSDHRLLRRL